METFAHEDIIARLAPGTPGRSRVLLAPGMAREEPRMSLGACPVPRGFSATFLAKMFPGDFVHRVRQRQSLCSFLETGFDPGKNPNVFCFKAITARGGQGLQSQRMESLEISVLEDISAPQAQQHLPHAPVGNTVMPQVRNCRNVTGDATMEPVRNYRNVTDQELQLCNRSCSSGEDQELQRCCRSGAAALPHIRNYRNSTGQELQLCSSNVTQGRWKLLVAFVCIHEGAEIC